jgi:hypothetical protein
MVNHLHDARVMIDPEPRRVGWTYYAAVVVFLGVLAFAVLGLVRSSSLAGAAQDRKPDASTSTASPTRTVPPLASGPVPTPQIPPPIRSFPTEPPSRTYLHSPPEQAAAPQAQPRR